MLNIIHFLRRGDKLERIIRQNETIITNQRKAHHQRENIMAAIDDLKSAVTGLQSTTEAVLIKIEELKNKPDNEAAIIEAVTAINDASTRLSNAVQG